MGEQQSGDGRSVRLSRRAALRLASGAGAAALLAACGGSSATTPPTAAPAVGQSPVKPTGASASVATSGGAAPTAASGTAAAGTSVLTLPTPAVKLPTSNMTFRWVHSGPGPKGLFFKAYFEAYHGAHPNITVQLDQLPWPEIGKVVPLGVQNGNAPDVFQIPLNFTGAQAVQAGWVHPLDDIIPNFAQWKAAFPPDSFLNGVHVFNGKTYTFPFISNKTYDTLLLYNVDYLAQAGIDPQAKPLTWDEYRAAAKKLTQQGAGKYYGVIIEGNQTNRFAAFVANLARMAGAVGSTSVTNGNINWKTGAFNYTTDQYLAAIDLLLGIKSDGSIFPGSLALNALEARSQFPKGVAAMMLQGPFNIIGWKTSAPNFKFDVASQPVPNTGTPMPLSYGATGGYFWAYAKTKYPEIAGDIFHYLGTEEGQATFVRLSGGGERATFPQANKVSGLDPRVQKVNALFDQQLRLEPNPSVRNPDVEKVNLERKTVTPDFGTTVQGIFTGQLRDAKQAMQDLTDRTEKELDRAIKAAQAKGAKVSRDDWVFPNWDPTKDYTQADYAALKK